MITLRSLRSVSLTTVLAGSLLLGGTGMVLAQDDEETTGTAFPNHIHAGTCDDLDPNPAAPLHDITEWLNDTDDETKNSPQGVLTTGRAFRDETYVHEAVDNRRADPH